MAAGGDRATLEDSGCRMMLAGDKLQYLLEQAMTCYCMKSPLRDLQALTFQIYWLRMLNCQGP
jgi:hypothetical protein